MSNRGKTQALDVLGDILEDTEEEARLEQERLAAELRKREEEAKAAAEAERLRRAEEAQQKIAAEEAERIEAAARRSAVDEALRELEKEPEAAPAPIVVVEPPKKSPVGAILAAAAAVIILGGSFFAWQTLSKPILDNETLYAPVAFAPPSANTANNAEQQIAVLGRPEVEEEAPAPAPRSSSRRSSSSRSTPSPGLNLGGSSLRR